ncbi:MAG: Holliday junction resolvase RuvX [Oscillospiraceae bacterium]|jgi:putative Holliday junction resolvase|nr:Holliday junction resolvase RuvX [Oscillospiraceae bacterium]
MIILGIDYGEQRTGVAASDPMGILASPVTVLREPARKKRAAEIARLAAERQAGKIVVGLPVNMDGTRGEKAHKCEQLAEDLRRAAGLPVVLWDERLSTVAAHRALSEADVRGQKRKDMVDSVAAVIILQSYLDSIAPADRKNSDNPSCSAERHS